MKRTRLLTIAAIAATIGIVPITTNAQDDVEASERKTPEVLSGDSESTMPIALTIVDTDSATTSSDDNDTTEAVSMSSQASDIATTQAAEGKEPDVNPVPTSY